MIIAPEHAKHSACWMAYPYRAEEWSHLEAAQREFIALAVAIAETETVRLLHATEPPALLANHANVECIESTYGDCWTRDTGPIFARDDAEEVALVFRFNGWGGKFLMPGDPEVGGHIAKAAGVRVISQDFVLEGGAIELDGEGTLLTTPCLQLSNRAVDDRGPASLTQIAEALSVDKVVCIEGQLANDHTDGHIDTLARFVRPGEVVCMRGSVDDPNGAMLLFIEEQLASAQDAQGRTLQVHTIPSPGAVQNEASELLAASYCNYYLANDQVIVPTYGVPADHDALNALSALFPERRVRGLSARAIIEGGGAFHCITQQQPALPNYS